MLERAIQIAAEAHAGQKDKGGAPYILHPLRVMLAVEGDEARQVAVLHDVLEDCPEFTAEHLRRAGFSEPVLAAIEALTKRAGERYDDFIARIKPNPLAAQVKLADLADNSDLSRIARPGDADFARLRKYNRARAVLVA
jgi:(p)ppGpp synthase/HD superfamily hydrolase